VIKVPTGVYPHTHQLIEPSLEPSYELAYVLGVLKGDGSVFKIERGKGSECMVQLRVTNREFAEKFKIGLIKLNLNPRIDLVEGKIFRVQAYSKLFYEWYSSLSLDDIEKLISSEESLIKAFLSGFYDSEGYKTTTQSQGYEYTYVAMSNTDRKLMEMIGRLLRKIGFTNKLQERANKTGWTKKPFRVQVWLFLMADGRKEVLESG